MIIDDLIRLPLNVVTEFVYIRIFAFSVERPLASTYRCNSQLNLGHFISFGFRQF